MKPAELNSTLSGAFSSHNLDLGSASSFGIAIDYPVLVDGLYAGLRVEHFSSSSAAGQIAPNSSAMAQSSLSGTPVMLTGTYLYPWLKDLQLGATMGFGMALGYQTAVEISNSDLPTAQNGKLEYAGAPFAGLFAATAAYDLGHQLGIRFETGYRVISSHNMKATSNYENIRPGDTLATRDGMALRVDASAFYTGFSIAMKL